MKKIVIIGNGYVGSKVYKKLSLQYENIQLLKEYNYNDPFTLKHTLFKELNDIFSVNNSEVWVVNCVGFTGKPNVDACELQKEKCWSLNVTFPNLLAYECLRENVKLINISSGCIYDGKEVYKENDWPNFGVDSSESSWYSRTKHASELCLKTFPNIYTLRIRMPICEDFNSSKNYLSKILNYDNLLADTNSKTVLSDLIYIVEKIMNKSNIPFGIYNCVNPSPLSTKQLTEILIDNKKENLNWKLVSYQEVKKHIKANRSNCILSTEKSSFYGIELPKEKESLTKLFEAKNENKNSHLL